MEHTQMKACWRSQAGEEETEFLFPIARFHQELAALAQTKRLWADVHRILAWYRQAAPDKQNLLTYPGPFGPCERMLTVRLVEQSVGSFRCFACHWNLPTKILTARLTPACPSDACSISSQVFCCPCSQIVLETSDRIT